MVSTERSTAFGSGGALAGAMMAIVSPGCRRGGLISTGGIEAERGGGVTEEALLSYKSYMVT